MARLAFFIANLGGGGAERVAIDLIRGFVARGHEVDLLVMKAEGELLSLVPSSVRVFDLRVIRVRKALGPLIHYLRARRPAALQVSMWPLTIVAIIAAKLSRTGVRVVVSDHSTLGRQYGGSALTIAMLKVSTRLFYPLADARIVVSIGSANDLASLSNIGRDQFTVVYNPVPAPLSPIETNYAVERLWSGNEPRILAVGALKREKNHALLIRALAKLVETRPAKLMILGEGVLRGELEALATELGIADRVLMPGFVLNPSPFYASADVFVLSSDYEGYPLVLVEAMHHGLRIVSTDCESGPNEILDSGRFGRLVRPGDEAELAAAIHDALSSNHDPEAGRQRAIVLSLGSFDRYEALLLSK